MIKRKNESQQSKILGVADDLMARNNNKILSCYMVQKNAKSFACS